MNNTKEKVNKKIAAIIRLAAKGLDPKTIRETLEDAGMALTQDYVTHTVRSWESVGKDMDPDVVRAEKSHRKGHKPVVQPVENIAELVDESFFESWAETYSKRAVKALERIADALDRMYPPFSGPAHEII